MRIVGKYALFGLAVAAVDLWRGKKTLRLT
jgi:hypothetical protein